MSILYKENNAESAKALYSKCTIYKGTFPEEDYPNLKNFHTAERYLYGRVDRNYVPIVPHSNAPFENLNQTNVQSGPVFRVQKFVARAFNDLNQQFAVKSMSGHIRADDPILSKLQVKKAYQPASVLYNDFYTGVHQAIFQEFRNRDYLFSDFPSFMHHLSSYLASSVAEVPFTYPAFVKSRYCPMTTTGLVIEIATEAADNDLAKIEKFKQSPNWQFYLNACRSYGFSVDVTAPWRLVADIGTAEMVNYARTTPNCSYASTDMILSPAYEPAHMIYFQNFIEVLLRLYNDIKRDYVLPIKSGEYSWCGTERVEPASYTVDTLKEIYGEYYFLELYIALRLMEEPEVSLTEQEQQILIRDTIRLAKSEDITDAVDIFESIVGQTYSYSGSLTDLLHRAKIRKEEAGNVLSSA